MKRRNMKAAKPARRFCRKPIARTVGSETGLFRQHCPAVNRGIVDAHTALGHHLQIGEAEILGQRTRGRITEPDETAA